MTGQQTTHQTEQEKELFLRIAQGDEAAFEELFHRYVPQVQPVIQKMVRSEAVTKDLIQDIFLNIWLRRDKLNEIESPRHWIFRIVYNRTYTWLEQQAVKDRVAGHLGHDHSEEATASNAVEASVSFAETSRLVAEAIRQLPDRTRQIYQLSREAGLKNAEIAEQLGISIQTVKNTLSNAGRSIRDYLAGRGIIIPLILVTYWIQ